MRVNLIAPALSRETVRNHLVVQARLFRERGDEVYLTLPVAPATLPDDLTDLVTITTEPSLSAELYVYHLAAGYPLPASLHQQDQGLVLVHDHGSPSVSPQFSGKGGEGWLAAHFADLCLVDNAARHDDLVSQHGLPPERIYVLPPLDREAAYRDTLVELVDRALADDRLPAPKVAKSIALPETAPEATPGWAAMKGAFQLAQRQADVMQRDYTVHSRIPLLGGLVAGVRRTLTSHLREPYLDPTLERQVAFNRTVVTWLDQVQARLEALEAEVQQLQKQSPVAGGDGDQQSISSEQVSDVG